MLRWFGELLFVPMLIPSEETIFIQMS